MPSPRRVGLSGRPDALIKDDGAVIPVSIKPMSKKVRDRHVIELIAHLRLVEEDEGVRPPYGILLMGKGARKVKIRNTEEKQRWLESLIDEMNSIIGGVPAVPAPALYKCKHCDVNRICKHSAYTAADSTPSPVPTTSPEDSAGEKSDAEKSHTEASEDE